MKNECTISRNRFDKTLHNPADHISAGSDFQSKGLFQVTSERKQQIKNIIKKLGSKNSDNNINRKYIESLSAC